MQGDSAAYHGYWGINFDRVDAHLGTDQDFGAFVNCAHSLGMKVYMDMVVNHTANVVGLSPGGSFISPAEKPYRTCKGKKFEPALYVTKTFPCMKASNMPYTPFLAANEKHLKTPGLAERPDLLPQPRRHRLQLDRPGRAGAGRLLRARRPLHRAAEGDAGLADVYSEWVRKYKLDGFRVDTAKHVNAAFFRLWAPRILSAARAAGVNDFEIFGEVTLNDAIELSAYVRNRGLPNVLDFPFQDVATGFAAGRTAPTALADRIADDDYFRYTPNVMPTPVTFLGNHDMGRAAFQLEQHGATGDQLLPRAAARLRRPLPAARRADGLLRGRGRDDRERRGQGGPAGHVPDPGRRVEDGAAGRLAADRRRLLLRRDEQPDRAAPEGARRAQGRAPGALDRAR